MKFLEQKTSPLWWLGNVRYLVYFIREATGVFIALFIIYYISVSFYFKVIDPTLTTRQWLSTIKPFVDYSGLTASIIHTLTWLWVTTKITPIQLKKSQQLLLFIFFLGAWIGFSYLALRYLYVR